MKYKYTAFLPEFGQQKWTRRPMIEIEIFGRADNRKFNALIGSGADCSLFNIEVAKLLGFDLSQAKTRDFTGIVGATRCYILDKVEIKVEDFDRPVSIPVGFIERGNVGLLLGQDGFFDSYKIKFERDHDTFEITRVKK